MSIHEIYIRRCFELAKRGKSQVEPNPIVGAVIVYQNRIIGEGFHEKYGGAHAEVNAIKSVDPLKLYLLPHSTIYVSLEPCHHFGKTPPCVNLILKHKIPKVVISVQDPNPLVAGKSIEKLRNQNVAVITDVLKEEGIQLIQQFLSQFS